MRPRRDSEKRRVSPANRSQHTKPQRQKEYPRNHLLPVAGSFGISGDDPSRRFPRSSMAGQSTKWMILVAAIWIQGFTGTNFDFSAYSSHIKSVLGISQVQLNYLAVASDLGKAFGWSSGLALLYLPLPVVLLTAALMGFLGYGLQWLVIQNFVTLPYFVVFLLCLVAGTSICWFNTVCFVLCIRNFPDNRALALSLTVSFNGLSPALYTLAANALSPNGAVYLLLNAFFPLLVSVLALFPILLLQQSTLLPILPDRRDSPVFQLLYFLALITGFYLLLLNYVSSIPSVACFIFAGAIILLLLPASLPRVVDWSQRKFSPIFSAQLSGFDNEVDSYDKELQKELLAKVNEDEERVCVCCEKVSQEGQGGAALGEEHTAKMLMRRLDFWLYYVAYFCGGTVGLVYSNNLGQIMQSLGGAAEKDMLITLYSACSFFGRLLSAAPDFLRGKLYWGRTAWLVLALAPMPLAFFLLATTPVMATLQAGTALIGLSSGFIFAAAVSVTSELFGPNSFGVNHNILITNIPIGSLVYGSLAALIYDANGTNIIKGVILDEGAIVCMGSGCYKETFLLWGCICMVGLATSFALFFRTRHFYHRSESGRSLTQRF